MKQNQQQIVVALVYAGLLAFGCGSNAQGTNKPAVRPAVISTSQRSTMGPLEMMKQSLNLSDDQAKALEPVLKEHLAKINALRRDTSLSRQDRVAKLKEMQTTLDTKIKQHLTPEQAEKWQKTRSNQQPSLQQQGQVVTNASPFSVRAQADNGQQPRPSWHSRIQQPQPQPAQQAAPK